MNLSTPETSKLLAVLLIGSVAGGSATLYYMDSQIQELENQIDASNKVVYINSGENSYTQLFEQVDQSVVYIGAQTPEGPAQGSGFIYSKNGFIVTNQHVIEDASRVEAGFTDGDTKRARIVGSDPYTDLAVLKVSKKGLEPLEIGNSSSVNVGQQAIAIGNPFGLRSSMTTGIISQKNRLLQVEQGFSIPNVLQTDASINPGNSGGPLLNIQGQVVGVNTAIETNTGTFSGVGFAIPANTVKRVVPQLIEEGDYEHPWIGVRGIDVSPEIADERNLENATGFMVVEVVNKSPADNAGLTAGNDTVEIDGQEVNIGGDIIVGMGGEKVRGISDILNYLAQETEVGQETNITVLRWEDGENIRTELNMTLGSRPDSDNQEE